MSIQLLHKTVDMVLTKSPKGKLTGTALRDDRKHGEDDKVLRLHFSLMGGNVASVVSTFRRLLH